MVDSSMKKSILLLSIFSLGMVSGIQGMTLNAPKETKEEYNVASVVGQFQRAQGNGESSHTARPLWSPKDAYGVEQSFASSRNALIFFALKTFGIRQEGTAFDYSNNATENELFTQALQWPLLNVSNKAPTELTDPPTINDTIAKLFHTSNDSTRSILSISSTDLSNTSAPFNHDVLSVAYTPAALSLGASKSTFTWAKELLIGNNKTGYTFAGARYSIKASGRTSSGLLSRLLLRDPDRLGDNCILIAYSKSGNKFYIGSRFVREDDNYTDMEQALLNVANGVAAPKLNQYKIVLHELYYVKNCPKNDDGKRSFLARHRRTIIAGTLIAGVGGAAALYYRYGRGR